jgi:hypothetical protein
METRGIEKELLFPAISMPGDCSRDFGKRDGFSENGFISRSLPTGILFEIPEA